MNLQEAIDIINCSQKDKCWIFFDKNDNINSIIHYRCYSCLFRRISEIDLLRLAESIFNKELIIVVVYKFNCNSDGKPEYQVIKNYGDEAVQYRANSIEECEKYIKLQIFS